MAVDTSPNVADIAALEAQDRLARHERAWLAYDGDGPKALAPSGDDQPDDNIRLDYASLIVDKGVSFLAGEGGVSVQLSCPETLEAELYTQAEAEAAAAATAPDPAPAADPSAPVPTDAPPSATADPTQPDPVTPDPTPAVDAEALVEELRAQAEADAMAELDAAWPERKRAVDIINLATNGGVTGHAWVRLLEDGSVRVLDPSNVTVIWDENDVEVVEEYRIEWTTEGDDGQDVLRRKRIVPDDTLKPSSWTIFDEQYSGAFSDWVAVGPPDGVPWGRSYPPVMGCQNLPSPNTYYGRPDLTPARLDQIEQLESIASDMRRIVRLHGHPIPVVIGQEAWQIAEIDVAIGELLALPNEQSKLTQLTIAELTSSLALYAEVKTTLFETSHIPKVALGDTTNSGPASGVALHVEYAPSKEVTDKKHLTYGELIVAVTEAVLDLRGKGGWQASPAWPDPLPTDTAAEATEQEAELRMGVVSKRTIAEKRGYDWETEQQRIADEKQDGMARMAEAFAVGNVPGDPALDPTAAAAA